MSTETWRPVYAVSGRYEVSDLGRVRRALHARVRGGTPGRVLTAKRSSNGYAHVDLSVNDHKKRFLIHRLVAEAFIGRAPSPEHQVNHKNGDKQDNRVINLEWCTRSENARHACATGLKQPVYLSGEKNGRARLTRRQVAEIRASAESHRTLAKRYGVARSTIQAIRTERNWRNEDLRVREFPTVSH